MHWWALDFAHLAHPIAAPLSMTQSVSLSREDHQRLRLGFDTLGNLFPHMLQLVAVLFTECRDDQLQCRHSGLCIPAAQNYCNEDSVCDDESDEPADCSE